ncbi:MAG: hypothetical protein ACOCY1_02870 [Halovenus sp.]
MSIANYFRLSVDRQRQLSRTMQLILFGLIFVGLERQSPTIVLNALLGFSITFLPAILERDHEIPMNPGITLWITAAVFLHAVGIIGIPGTGIAFYSAVPFYDHITHALSASVVAGVGYATVRGLDQHSDGISLPPRVTFVFILVFVLAFGVLWELVEFGVDVLTTRAGVEMSGFTQHGLNDTMLDLVFNTLGGVVVAIWGTVYLTDIADAIQERFESRDGDVEK